MHVFVRRGPSGSGKTTLLNTLAHRLDRNVKVTGEMRLNGKEFTQNDVKQVAGYVMQARSRFALFRLWRRANP